MVASAGIAGVAQLLNGMMSFAGQNSANALNAQLFHDSQQFQREMVASAQQYNAYMSNTAHQREVADLRKAGLNPLLSAGLGGGSSASATSPVLGSPSAPDIKNPVPHVDPLVMSTAKKLHSDTVVNQSTTALNDATKINKSYERRLLNAQENKTNQETALTKISQLVKSSEIQLNSALAKKALQETLNSRGITQAQIDFMGKQGRYYNNSATNLKQQYDINAPVQNYSKTKYARDFEYVKQTMNGIQLPTLNFGFHGDIPHLPKRLTPIGFR